jgi:hypothetical protein
VVVYGDKSTSHISVQLYKSEAAGGKRKVKDLLAEELTFREHHDDVHYTGGGEVIHALHHHRQRGKVDFR